MSWIEDYEPIWAANSDEAKNLFSCYLDKWVGKHIESTRVGWFHPDDEWDENLPIVLVISGVQYEVCWQNFECLAITSNQIDTNNCICAGEVTPYKVNAHEVLNSCLGKKIVSVKLGMSSMTIEGKDIPILNSLNFRLVGGYLSIFNDLDQNGLSDAPPNI